eukprot:2686176-Pyramimonas_sp.AAC.1
MHRLILQCISMSDPSHSVMFPSAQFASFLLTLHPARLAPRNRFPEYTHFVRLARLSRCAQNAGSIRRNEGNSLHSSTFTAPNQHFNVIRFLVQINVKC